jgi:endonuclease/exonuclease/phosphatase family metal-dependent hydrolase
MAELARRWGIILLITLASALLSHAAEAVEHDEPLALRVVAYNVWGVPHVTPDRPERIAAIGEYLALLDPGIVMLQEVWLDEDAATIGAALARAGLVHQHHFGPGHISPKGSGLWIGSRYPIERVRFERFSVGEKVYIPWHLDWMAQKGVAIARLRTPAGPIDVADTHFQSPYLFVTYGFVQISQAVQMAGALAPPEDAGQTPPLLVAGDFNAEPNSLPIRVLLSRLSLEPASDSFDIDAVLSRPGAGSMLRVIGMEQHLTEPARLADGRNRFLSDHPCIVVDYELTACDDCAVPGPKRWRAVAGEALDALRQEMAETERVIVAGRVLCVAFPLLAAWSGRRAVRRAPRRLRVWYAAAAALFLTLGSWLGYIGWDFGPYKLEILAAQVRGLGSGS